MKATLPNLLLFASLGLIPGGLAAYHHFQRIDINSGTEKSRQARSQSAILKISGGDLPQTLRMEPEADSQAAIGDLKGKVNSAQHILKIARETMELEVKSQEEPLKNVQNTHKEIETRYPPPDEKEVARLAESVHSLLPSYDGVESGLSRLDELTNGTDPPVLKKRVDGILEFDSAIEKIEMEQQKQKARALAEEALKGHPKS